MGDTILLFESRDLCYESNRYFIECMAEAFEKLGYPTEIYDLSVQMEEKLEGILKRREHFLAAFDFNSLLPRLELDDGTPYLTALGLPFFNYLVDHPFYHHIGIKRSFPGFAVICIDSCHQSYIQQYYPQIAAVHVLSLGAMKADLERSLGQKRQKLLFLGTYEPEGELYDQLLDYPKEQQKEIAALIEQMDADHSLTQEAALMQYLTDKGETVSPETFVRKMNSDYLADKYLRNKRRREAVLAAAAAKVPFTVTGHGFDVLADRLGSHVTVRNGIGFAASLQMMADAAVLLNVTPGFHGGLHDRVYSAMLNRAVCLTEGSGYAKKMLIDGQEAVLYDSRELGTLTEAAARLCADTALREEIAERAFLRASRYETWEKRVERIIGEFL